MVYKFFDKKNSGANISGDVVKSTIRSNQELAEELHKPIITKFENFYDVFCVFFISFLF